MRLALALLSFALAAPAIAQESIPVRIEFDDRSTVRLSQAGSWVEIEVYLTGEADPTRAPTGQEGMLALRQESYLVQPVDQTVLIGGSFAAAPLGWSAEARLTVVIGARRPLGEPDLLNCDKIDRPLTEVLAETADGPIMLACEWFGDVED